MLARALSRSQPIFNQSYHTLTHSPNKTSGLLKKAVTPSMNSPMGKTRQYSSLDKDDRVRIIILVVGLAAGFKVSLRESQEETKRQLDAIQKQLSALQEEKKLG